jgi:hypothetical protein
MIVNRADPSDVFLALIESNSFNLMDGKKISAELRANRHLWDAVLFNRPGDGGITLRDMPGGQYNADTVWILTDMVRQKSLFETAKAWEADNIIVMTPTDTWQADRYDESSPYTLKPLKKPRSEDTVKGVLAAYQKDETRVVFRLWWD